MNKKRHHFVPKFLLRRFSSDPSADNPPVYVLSKETGHTRRSSVNNEAVISHYNRLEAVPNLPDMYVEDVLAAIESLAAGMIDELLAEGQPPLAESRLTLALFFWLQHARTPLGRAWQVFAQEQAARFGAMQRLLDTDFVREVYGGDAEFTSADALEAWRVETLKQLDDGTLWFGASHDHEVLGMFVAADMGASKVATEMSWMGLRAPADASFICSDHPLAIVDDKARYDEPVTWFSSPNVEVTFPLDPSFCLLLVPGPPTYAEAPVDAGTVLEINLRTYAWGHWAIYGPTQAAVQQVRARAKREKRRVGLYEPRAPRLHILEVDEGQTVARNVQIYRPAKRGDRRRRD